MLLTKSLALYFVLIIDGNYYVVISDSLSHSALKPGVGTPIVINCDPTPSVTPTQTQTPTITPTITPTPSLYWNTLLCGISRSWTYDQTTQNVNIHDINIKNGQDLFYIIV